MALYKPYSETRSSLRNLAATVQGLSAMKAAGKRAESGFKLQREELGVRKADIEGRQTMRLADVSRNIKQDNERKRVSEANLQIAQDREQRQKDKDTADTDEQTRLNRKVLFRDYLSEEALAQGVSVKDIEKQYQMMIKDSPEMESLLNTRTTIGNIEKYNTEMRRILKERKAGKGKAGALDKKEKFELQDRVLKHRNAISDLTKEKGMLRRQGKIDASVINAMTTAKVLGLDLPDLDIGQTLSDKQIKTMEAAFDKTINMTISLFESGSRRIDETELSEYPAAEYDGRKYETVIGNVYESIKGEWVLSEKEKKQYKGGHKPRLGGF